MKHLRRLFCLLLATALIASLCACGKKGADDQSGDTTRVTTPDDYSSTPDSDDIYIESDTSRPTHN